MLNNEFDNELLNIDAVYGTDFYNFYKNKIFENYGFVYFYEVLEQLGIMSNGSYAFMMDGILKHDDIPLLYETMLVTISL